MSAALTLATPDHMVRLAPLVAAFHDEEGIDSTEESREAALAPLLEGIPHGCVYLIGPARAPIGYIVITFTWSLEYGGLDAMIDELFIRPPVRGRGIATEVLISLPGALAAGGLKAIHLEVAHDNKAAKSLYHRAGFAPKEDYLLMTRKL